MDSTRATATANAIDATTTRSRYASYARSAAYGNGNVTNGHAANGNARNAARDAGNVARHARNVTRNARNVANG